VGAGSLVLLPYFEGERTPNVPDGTGVFFGVNADTFSARPFARAAMEGATLGMNYGLNRLRSLGVTPTQVRATGGGSNSAVWRQIMADVFNVEVVCTQTAEGAAYGAALQAIWCSARLDGTKVEIWQITDEFVKLDRKNIAKPKPENVKKYRKLQALQDGLSRDLRRQFTEHHALMSK
jgi:xylulokinase